MNNTIEYKGYVGSIEFSQEDSIFYGKVLGIKALISYEGTTAEELINDFHSAVNGYLELCEENNSAPEQPYIGHFDVQIPPELHKLAAIGAISRQVSLNSLIEQALIQYLKA